MWCLHGSIARLNKEPKQGITNMLALPIDKMFYIVPTVSHTLNTKKIRSDLNNLNTFTKETGSNKVKLPKVGSNAIVHVPVRAGPKNIVMVTRFKTTCKEQDMNNSNNNNNDNNCNVCPAPLQTIQSCVGLHINTHKLHRGCLTSH
jgi:hypothetical protein